MNQHIYPDSKQLAEALADRIVAILSKAVEQKGNASLVLAGGSTFLKAYACLAEKYSASLPWDKVKIYFGDERYVPSDEGRSNYFQIEEVFLKKVKPVVHRVETERGLEGAVTHYADLLPSEFDLVLLGIGTDGHTASLFPGSLKNLRPNLKVMASEAELTPLVPRITLTPEALNQCQYMLIAASGSEKATIVAKSHNIGSDLPIGLLHPLEGAPEWFLDADAAKEIV